MVSDNVTSLGSDQQSGNGSGSSKGWPSPGRKTALRKAGSRMLWDQGKYVDIRTAERNLLWQWIIPPRYKYKVLWDMFIGGIILYSVIIVPYRIGFDDTPRPWSLLDWSDILIDFLFFLDIILTFRTAYVDNQGTLVVDPKKIRANYIRGMFVPDWLSTIPFDRI